MNRKLLLFRVCATLCCFQQGLPSEPSPPRKVVPEIGTAVIIDDQTVEITRFAKRQAVRKSSSGLPPKVEIEVKKGTLEPISTTEIVEVVESQTVQIKSNRILCLQADGGGVSFESLKTRLATPSPVILANQGDEIDSQFLKLFKPDTLIVLLPSPSKPPKTVDSKYP